MTIPRHTRLTVRMRLEEFDFTLPEELIASAPAAKRDASRLLVAGENPKNRVFSDICDYLREGDLLVMNDSKVIPARLRGKRQEAAVEVLLHKRAGVEWKALAKPARKLKSGDVVEFAPDFAAEITGREESGEVRLKFAATGEEFRAKLEKYGLPPLPPYIKREAAESDRLRYQTVYAREEGSVAAPTAGLHFTPELLARLGARGVKTAFVTLHVGAGTFAPVKTENIAEHKMHSEEFEISEETAAAISGAKRVIAVGTTSLRAMESAWKDGAVRPFRGETDIFITPGYEFRTADLLITNFHLPKSTLLMLVSAFAGYEKIRAAYVYAIKNGYRFYSYGDACLLKRRAEGA